MSSFEVGSIIFDPATGSKDVPTKKALKELIKDAPSTVRFYPVTAFPNPSSESLRTTADKIPEDVTAQVTGPNPYTSRKWYANVTRKGDKLTVK